MAHDAIRTVTDTSSDGTDQDFKSVTGTDVVVGPLAKRGLDVVIQSGGANGTPVAPQPADSGTSTIVSVTTAEIQLTAAVGQVGITITNLGSQVVHYRLSTGVVTTDAEIRRNDQLVLADYAGSVFVRRASGTADVQVDRMIRS